MKNIQTIVTAGLKYIASQQQENGSFLSDQGKPTTFYTGLILSTLTECGATLHNTAISFLQDELFQEHQVNYWQRKSKEYTAVPYPNDIDDTFVAMQAFQVNAPDLITEERIADLISLLLSQEAIPGGPYRTWITHLPDTAWQDIDIVANSNVAVFLQTLGVELPQLYSYFDSMLTNGVRSLYYHDEITILYFLSRAYRNDRIAKRILELRNTKEHWGNPLHTAFAIMALISHGHTEGLASAISYILETEKDGQWQTTNLYVESIDNSIPTYSSCSAYVSACCVAALQAYERANKHAQHQHTDEEAFVKSVHDTCTTIITDSLLKSQLHNALSKLAVKDPHSEIALLPYTFSKHLKMPIGKETVYSLSVANTLGWIGYSVYDSILDGEDKICLLPLANMCIKAMINIFKSVSSEKEYALVQRILEDIDSSTLWEYMSCSVLKMGDLPDYGNHVVLAKKSLGHAIGPLLLLQDSDEQTHVEEFFTHYLIAKQLNDDAHDWQEDLKNGWINSVSVEMIEQLNRLDETILQEYFWETHIETIVDLITHHISQAKAATKKITLLKEVTFLEALLVPLEQSASQALIERDRTKRFLEHMKY